MKTTTGKRTKLFSFALALALCLTLLPATAFADADAAPGISNVSVSDITAESATINFTLDSPATDIFWFFALPTADEPEFADGFVGDGSAGRENNLTLSASVNSVTIDYVVLEPGTQYICYVSAMHEGGAVSKPVTATFTTPGTAMSLSISEVKDITPESATVVFNISLDTYTSADIFWVLHEGAATTMTAEEVAFSDDPVQEGVFGEWIANDERDPFFIIDGLDAETTYTVYMVARNLNSLAYTDVASYTFNMQGAPSSGDANLISIAGQSIAAGTEAGTKADPKTASIAVPNSKTSITAADLTVSEGASKNLFNSAFSSVVSSAPLDVGANHVYVRVTAADEVTALYYDVTVTRAATLSGDAGLISVAGVNIASFGGGNGTVASQAKTAGITVPNSKASIGYSDVTVAAGATFAISRNLDFTNYLTPDETVALSDTQITHVYIEVKAEDGTKLLYMITVTRQEAGSAAPSITSSDNYSCMAGAGGSFTLAADGTAPITWSVSGQPAGVGVSGNILTVAASTAAGTYTFTVTATNTGGSAAQTFTLRVTSGPAAPTITGPASMYIGSLGYAARSTDVYTVTGNPAPTVSKISGHSRISWNDATKRIDIPAGLWGGTYPVVLEARNSEGYATVTFTLTVYGAMAGSASDGDSGSSGGSSTTYAAPGGSSASGGNTPAPVSTAAATSAAQSAAASATAAGASVATVNLRNPGAISLEALRAIDTATGSLQARLQADSLTADGRAVDARITLDPARATGSLNLSASTASPAAVNNTALFERYFQNDVMTVALGQQGSFGQPVEIAAKLGPALDTRNLAFYSYDPQTNRYRQIPSPGYWVDTKGYVHFTTELAGNIVISDGALTKR